MEQDRVIGKGGIRAACAQTERGLFLRALAPEGAPLPEAAALPFIAELNGETNGSFGADSDAYAADPARWVQTAFCEEESRLTVRYEREECAAECVFAFVRGGAAVYVSARLTARVPLAVRGLRLFLPLAPYTAAESGAYSLSFRRNEWQGEGQWSTHTLAQLGFASYCRHPSLSAFAVGGRGSQTTARFYPSLLLRGYGKSWLFEGDVYGSWSAALCVRGEWGREPAALCFSFGEERGAQPPVFLQAGESFSCPRVLVAVSGGDVPLMRAVYAAKRQEQVRGEAPAVTVNDYMCSLWAAPEERAEHALIDAAAELGADCFVIDDGWFLYEKGKEAGCRLGDWNTDGERFGKGGLAGMLGYIRAKGMRAGLWLEPEAAGVRSRVFREHPGWFVRAGGAPYGSCNRYFLDFTREDVRAYLFSVFEALHALGVRYFKIDYNDSYGAEGCEPALRENYAAVRAFYAELGRRFPDTLLENCASGGKRSSGEIARLFDVQSISDQEDFLLYPSVVCGSLVNTPPERLGVWCLPRPVGFYEREKPLSEVPPPSHEQIVYNMVNALAGSPCLGSRIDLLTEAERAPVREGLALARKLRPFLRRAFPQFPLGLTGVGSAQHALLFTDGEEGILYLWANGRKEFSLPFVKAATCSQLYPQAADCNIADGHVTLPAPYTARMFRIGTGYAGDL